MSSKKRIAYGVGSLCALLLTAVHTNLPKPMPERPEPELLVDLGQSILGDRLVSGINNREELVAVRQYGNERQSLIYGTANPTDPNRIVFLAMANGINNLGQLAGAVPNAERTQAAIWDSRTGIKPIKTFADRSFATGLNDHGDVVGCLLTDSGKYSGFVYSEKTGLVNLNELTGIRINFAMAINNRREIVGSAVLDGLDRAFLWSESTGLIDLGISNQESSRANGINNHGLVVGHFRREGQMRPFLWSPETGSIDLNDLLGNYNNWQLCTASDVNDKGQVVGVGLRDGQTRSYMLQLRASQVQQRSPAELALALPSIKDATVIRQ